MKNFKDKYGSWAIVTGSSSGIGVEFAKQLAAVGMNLVLIARRTERLEQLGAELAEKHGIQYKAVSCDLSTLGFEKEVFEAIEGLDIGLLVNNAGINCEGVFYRASLDRNIQMMELNMKAPFILSYELGKRFIERGKGGIIFTASTSSFQATPYLTHYAATKAYLLSLAEGMNYEFKNQGVDVLAVCPGPTESEMTKGVKNNPIMMPAEPVVSLALKNLGKKVFVIPGFANKTMVFTTKRIFTRTQATNFMGNMMGKFLPKPKKKG
jgi:short-subunit dehydrogenase